MAQALAEAGPASAHGDVPIGAVVLDGSGAVIARAHNERELTGDPSAHAEVLALRRAAASVRSWRLDDCTLVVTLEPCTMCAGALVWSRMEKLFIGTMDPKSGGCGSIFNITGDTRLNHQVQVETGLLQEECEALMKDFFRKLRNHK